MAAKTCTSSVASVAGVVRHSSGHGSGTLEDFVAVEEPLEIRVNTQSVSVTMRTPGHDKELAAGFLFTEGMIHRRADLAGIAPCATARPDGTGNIVNATLAKGVVCDLAKLTRHVFASSSCGLCGKASIASVQMHFPALASGDFTVPLSVLRGLPTTLRAAQEAFSQTGGLHAAGIFDATGRLLIAHEDVGRHNAVDKVIGHGLLEDLLPFDRHILLVSGRASFEILQKALAARIPVLAAVSAPSSLAVDFARANGQTLVGFLRENSLNIYTHPNGIQS